jgi:hypothetical protein
MLLFTSQYERRLCKNILLVKKNNNSKKEDNNKVFYSQRQQLRGNNFIERAEFPADICNKQRWASKLF